MPHKIGNSLLVKQYNWREPQEFVNFYDQQNVTLSEIEVKKEKKLHEFLQKTAAAPSGIAKKHRMLSKTPEAIQKRKENCAKGLATKRKKIAEANLLLQKIKFNNNV